MEVFAYPCFAYLHKLFFWGKERTMNRIFINGLSWAIIIGSLCFFKISDCFSQSLQRFSFTQPKMGSPFTITFYAPDNSRAVSVATQAFHLIDSLNNIFSDYEENSELNQLSATAGQDQWVSISPSLFHILQLSKNASIKSKGAFDITVGPVVKLWRMARKEKRLPPDSLLQQKLLLVGPQFILLDTALQKAKLLKPGMALDLGGIAKGFIAQSVIDLLSSLGIINAMADAGGDIVMSLPPPEKSGWIVGINAPESLTELKNKRLSLHSASVATSGDVYQFVEIGGKKYSHIVNPKTGLGITSQRNVTVIAPKGELADWLATACSLLHIKKAMRLVKKYPGAVLLIMEHRNGKIKMWQSRNFKNYLVGN